VPDVAMMRSLPDPLLYEKALLDDWLRADLSRPGAQ
jgi:hypothetical protein